jgi:hypothetical protein
VLETHERSATVLTEIHLLDRIVFVGEQRRVPRAPLTSFERDAIVRVNVPTIAVGTRTGTIPLVWEYTFVFHQRFRALPCTPECTWHAHPISVQGPVLATWRCLHLPIGQGMVSPFCHATGDACDDFFMSSVLL